MAGLVDDGAVAMASALLGDGVETLFDNTNAALGVGDDDTAFAAAQTKLAAEENATNALRKGMNSGYPSRNPDDDGSLNKTRYQASFSSSEANFAWKEWAVFNNVTASAGRMLCRFVEELGTKVTGTWVLEVDITLATS